MATPKPQALALFDKLNELARKPKVSEFELASLKREASRLLGTKFVIEAHMLLGSIAVLEFDEATMRQHFEAATSASGAEPNVLQNYAASLGNLGLHEEAAAVIDRAFAKAPSEPDVLKAAISCNADVLNFERVEELLGTWKKMNLPREPLHKDLGEVALVAEFLQEHAIDAREVVTRQSLVRSVIRDARKMVLYKDITLLDNLILYQMKVHATNEEVVDINGRIFEALSNQAFMLCDKYFSWACTGLVEQQRAFAKAT